MSKVSLCGRTVLITGAARGLGRALAFGLAVREGSNVILLDRDEPGLDRLAEQIRLQSASTVRILVRDLLEGNCAPSLFDELKNTEIHGLVNNAGLTFFGPTEAGQLEQYRRIIDLDLRLVVELSLLFLARFKQMGGGFICNVTSLGSFVPIPYQAIYAAAKGAAQSFSESLCAENRGGAVTICTVAPSGIVTDMIAEAGLTGHMNAHRFSYLSPEEAARQVIRGLKRGRRLIIPGFVNRLIYLAINILPRGILLGLAGRIYDYDKYRGKD
jgi:short-subunit dehydrogenase